jgi:hypothetical protein
LTTSRIVRSGWLVGTRSSRSTYENNDPVTASDPRIAASIPDGDTESDEVDGASQGIEVP